MTPGCLSVMSSGIVAPNSISEQQSILAGVFTEEDPVLGMLLTLIPDISFFFYAISSRWYPSVSDPSPVLFVEHRL